MSRESFAVIGAGVAGLTCAKSLSASGHHVVVFEKSRGPGGRMCSKRTEAGSFDLGCQFLQANTAPFASQLDDWARKGVVVPWQGRLGTIHSGVLSPLDPSPTRPIERERWTPNERSSQLGRFLARDLEVLAGTRVSQVIRSSAGHLLRTESRGDFGPFEHLIVATPAPQALPFVSLSSTLVEELSQVGFCAVWAAAIELVEERDYGVDAAWLTDSPLRWVSRRAAQQGRPSGAGWVLQASREWSEAHCEEDNDAVANALAAAFSEAVSDDLMVVRKQAHLWRFGLVSKAAGQPFLSDPTERIHYCGDGCLGNSVEDAWSSGSQLAKAIAESRNVLNPAGEERT